MKPVIQLVIVIILAGIATAGIISSVYRVVKERNGLREQVALQKDYLIGAENREVLLSEEISEAEALHLTLRTEMDAIRKQTGKMRQAVTQVETELHLKNGKISLLSEQLARERQKKIAAENKIRLFQSLLNAHLKDSLRDIKRRITEERNADRVMQQQVANIAQELAEMKANLTLSLRPAR